MQAITAESIGHFEDNNPPHTISCGSTYRWLGQKCRRFTRLAGQTLLCALDAIFFWGKFDPQFPAIVTKISLASLSCVGFVFLPYNVDLIQKTVQDVLFGHRAGNTKVCILASAKAVELISNLGLLLAGFTASMEGMAGWENAQSVLYRWMTPWGEATLLLGVGLTAAYLVMDHLALKALNNNLDGVKSSEILAAFSEKENDGLTGLELTAFEEGTVQIIPDRPLASHVRFCMDKDTLEHFLSQIKSLPFDDNETKIVLMNIVKDNIHTQLTINLGGQAALTAAGYVLMGIEKYYTPNSKVAAAINLGVGGAYWIKTFIETLREVNQRHRISQAIASTLLPDSD